MAKKSRKDEGAGPPGMGRTIRVYIALDADEIADGGPGREGVWATIVGDSLLRLDNVPGFSRKYALGDEVEIAVDEVGWLGEVKRRSGHSVIVLLLPEGFDRLQTAERLKAFASIGCGYEGGGGRLSFDVPTAELQIEAWRIAEAGERDGCWRARRGYWHA